MKTRIAALALLASATAMPAMAQQGTELGLLDCIIEGGVGMIVASSRDIACTFTPADSALAPEAYYGVVNRVGLDIGITGEAVMQWLVLAPTSDVYAPGALAGNYVGASAEASAAVGVGANVLVGGSQNTISLQPVSVQAQTGVNVAVGIAEFQLRSAAQ
jgi:hypothetical protein